MVRKKSVHYLFFSENVYIFAPKFRKMILFNLNGGIGQFLPPTKDEWVSLAELYELLN